jgi:hypothetical protein
MKPLITIEVFFSMNGFKLFAVAGIAAIGLASTAPQASGQINIRIGAEPSCPYGYYGSAPYGCAPDGYYGPQWFVGGRFVGAGQWFHGPSNFHGTVNNHFDPQHGYHGPTPNRGEHAPAGHQSAHFQGNEERDGRGHVTNGGHH